MQRMVWCGLCSRVSRAAAVHPPGGGQVSTALSDPDLPCAADGLVQVCRAAAVHRPGCGQASTALSDRDLPCAADGLVRVFAAASPGRLLCTLRGVPSPSKGKLTPLTSLHVGPEGPPDFPGAPEKPVVVVVGDAAGNVLTWRVPDGRPLGKSGVTEAEALACFQQVQMAGVGPGKGLCAPMHVRSGVMASLTPA